MTQKIFITDLPQKDEVETFFLVKYLALQEARDGKKYLNVVLTDASGDLEARVFHGAEEIAERLSKNNFVRAKGRVNLFQGRRQFILSAIERVGEDMVNPSDYIMKALEAPEEMYQALVKIVNGLSDVYIRELLQNIINDPEISRRLKLWQAGKSIHHAYQSGLLEHILSCSRLALTLSSHYKVNVNYVVAGTILHDLCKIYELTDGFNVDYTEEGKLVGHLVKGLELVDRFAWKIQGFPNGTRMHLKHILLSHHGEYEYGSPKIPQTSEAFLVHLIDNMDSKMNAVEMIKKTDGQSGHWSGFVKHLDRVIYKAELPFYPEYQTDPEPRVEKRPINKPVQSGELKQNFGKLLSQMKTQPE